MAVFEVGVVVRLRACVQVDDVDTVHAPHPQVSFLIDERSDATAYVGVHLFGQGQDELALLQVVEVDALVGAYPHAIVDGVVRQCADEATGIFVVIGR